MFAGICLTIHSPGKHHTNPAKWRHKFRISHAHRRASVKNRSKSDRSRVTLGVRFTSASCVFQLWQMYGLQNLRLRARTLTREIRELCVWALGFRLVSTNPKPTIYRNSTFYAMYHLSDELVYLIGSRAWMKISIWILQLRYCSPVNVCYQ